MEFDPTLSFSDNLARFQEEAERIDADCARILFDNLALLARDGDATRGRYIERAQIYAKVGC